MIEAGYHVRSAKNGREVLKWIYQHEPLDLLILDPDLPDASEVPLLEKIYDRIPPLPVLIHAFISDYSNHKAILDKALFVEKGGNSIEHLKRIAFELLQNPNPRQYVNSKDKNRHPPE